MRSQATVALMALLLEGCCPCRHEARECPAGPSPASQPAEPRLTLPGRLGPATQAAPASLEAWLVAQKLPGAGFERFAAAVKPLVGARVRWRLRSWGGEVTTGDGFETPSGTQPAKLGKTMVGRIRLISDSLVASATLSEVYDAGHPVVACLALFPPDGEPRFVRGEAHRGDAAARGVVMLEGTIWGTTYEGKGTLWLHECAVTPATAGGQ